MQEERHLYNVAQDDVQVSAQVLGVGTVLPEADESLLVEVLWGEQETVLVSERQWYNRWTVAQ